MLSQRTDQKVTISIVERLVHHRLIAQVHMNGDAVARSRLTGAANRVQSLHEIHSSCTAGVLLVAGHIERQPTHLIRIRRQLVPVAAQMAAMRCRIDGAEWPMNGRRPNAIQPRAHVFGAWRRKSAAGQLLGVQAVRAFLRRILADGQGVRVVGMGGLEMGAEAVEVLFGARIQNRELNENL